MKANAITVALASLATLAPPVQARSTIEAIDPGGGGGELPPYLQCVPYARDVTGVRIYGDAYTWWSQAEGRYARGNVPRIGAVMAVQPHGNSRLGHVAAVSKVVDSRNVLISHANWSQPGRIEENVRAVDTSPSNDWSEVRIWYGPSQSLGAGHWPLYGFIYNEEPGKRQPDVTKIAHGADPIGAIIAGRYR